MALNIVTVCSRYENLPVIYNSFRNYKDIKWHIAKVADGINLHGDFNKDNRVYVCNTICEQNKNLSKRANYVFSSLVEEDPNGFFCLLDDDTTLNPGMYAEYCFMKEMNINKMLIGRQIDKYKNTRLYGSYPKECCIDFGNVLCPVSVLNYVKYPDMEFSDTLHPDFLFWDECFKHFGVKNTIITQNSISWYNYLSDKPDSLDYDRSY